MFEMFMEIKSVGNKEMHSSMQILIEYILAEQ